jgi:hypothetical protein
MIGELVSYAIGIITCLLIIKAYMRWNHYKWSQYST